MSEISKVFLSKNPLVSIKVMQGHFATSSAHCNHYLDVVDLKTNALKAKDVAQELASPYLTCSLANTIVCMENTEMIGAFIADELLRDGTPNINSEREIHVVTPLQSVNGKLIFHDSMQKVVRDRNIVLLVASISSGKTMNKAIECIDYYGGNLIGISAIFCAHPKKFEQDIHSVFTSDDIPGYQFCTTSECDACATGRKLDAIISSDGYSNLN